MLRRNLLGGFASAIALVFGQQGNQRGVVLAGAPPVESRGGKRALLIGNQTYSHSPLLNPGNDARDVGAALQELGFRTSVLLNGTRSAMQSAITRFSSELSAGETAVFYYAGHGFQINAENYLVPVDFGATNATEARTQSLLFGEIKARLERTGAGAVVMILDSCRNNPFGSETTPGLALQEAGLGSYLAFAAAPGKQASDNSTERNGLFTKHLLSSIRQPVTVADLFRRVREEVYRTSRGAQIPYLHDQVISDVRLAATRATPQTVQDNTNASSDRLEQGMRLYHSGKCEEAAAEFDRLVRRQPTNAFLQNALGLAYSCASLFVPAVERFSMAIEIKPDYAAAYLNRGQTFLRTAQYELAVQDFTWAIEQAPETARFYTRRGTALFSLRRYEDAERDYNRAIELDAGDPYGYHGHGQLMYRLGKYREALGDLDAAIARKRDFGPAYEDRARTRDRLGDARGASADREAAKRFPR